MMPTTRWPLLALPLLVGVITISGLLVSAKHGRAVQAPKIGLDMVVDGNVHDATTNSMIVGPFDNCLGTAAPGNNAQHNHIVHLVIHDVEDIAGAQVRINHDDARLEVTNINWAPFQDPNTFAQVGFLNLPIDPALTDHRALIGASDFTGANTSLASQSYLGDQTQAISPDTPPKAPPDDTSYSAPTGGILASVTIQVKAGQAGQLLTMDLDDANPTPPGSSVDVYTADGIVKINLAESELFDGFHAEGTSCVPPATIPPPPGAPGGPGGQGSPGGPGGGPGGSPGTSGSAGASPGTGGASRTASPSTTSSASNGVGGNAGGGSSKDNGGTPVWVYALLIGAAVGLPLAGFAAWRYRERIPWFRGT